VAASKIDTSTLNEVASEKLQHSIEEETLRRKNLQLSASEAEKRNKDSEVAAEKRRKYDEEEKKRKDEKAVEEEEARRAAEEAAREKDRLEAESEKKSVKKEEEEFVLDPALDLVRTHTPLNLPHLLPLSISRGSPTTTPPLEIFLWGVP